MMSIIRRAWSAIRDRKVRKELSRVQDAGQ